MNQDLEGQIESILTDADEASRSLVDPTQSDGQSFLETAQRARGLLDVAEPAAVLAALDLDRLPDGSEPASLPAAIAQGEPTQVAELQRLVTLAHVATKDDPDTVEEVANTLQAGMDSGGEVIEATDDHQTEAADETDDGDSLGSQLESVVRKSITSFSGDLDALQADLESVGESLTDEDDSTDEDDDSDDEDGLLEVDSDRGVSRGVARYSTVPPGPSNRPALRGTARHSTMPDS